jgi:hypothetical protein
MNQRMLSQALFPATSLHQRHDNAITNERHRYTSEVQHEVTVTVFLAQQPINLFMIQQVVHD